MIRVRQVNVMVDAEDGKILKQCAKKLRVKENKIKDYKIVKKSTDARDKEKIVYSYEIDVEVQNEEEILGKNKSKDICKAINKEYEIKATGNIKLKNRPVIVGSGPAGLFCGYMLAKYGYKLLKV